MANGFNNLCPRERRRRLLTSVLLDLDGTLIDSNDAHAMAWLEALRSHGISVTFQEVREKIGMGGDQLLGSLGIFPENKNATAIERRRQIAFRRYLPQIYPFPGAKEMVEQLMSKGFKLVVASSSSADDLTALLTRAGLQDILRNFTSADDASASKPAPDIILAALRKVHAAPHEALLLGDTPYDIQAARRAGVDTIAFTCGGCTEAQLAGALAIYPGPKELLRELKKSPLWQRAA
jgi:HAD superfamily hydrolase (TIGR01509 family)